MKTDSINRKNFEDGKINTKIKLSVLWITLMMLYIYADILSLFSPGAVEEIIAGNMGPFPVTQVALLSASVLMIIPSLMILLSVLLKPKSNRIINLVAGFIYTAVSIGNLIGETWIYYLLFGIIEIAIGAAIIFSAWKWPGTEK